LNPVIAEKLYLRFVKLPEFERFTKLDADKYVKESRAADNPDVASA
jgi:hypothetical protein